MINLDKQISLLPKDIEFCTRCVVSNQRPRISFDKNGICSACQFSDYKETINWDMRLQELNDLCDKYRSKNNSYDVLVPCSGGKDASFVAHQLKYEFGMNPLTITFAPFIYTSIGFENLRNFVKSGFDNILMQPDGALYRKLSRLGFEFVGDHFLPFIYGQYCYAFHMALKFNIKLVFFGENPEAEYGGLTNTWNKPGENFNEYAEKYWKGTSIEELIKFGINSTNYISKDDFANSNTIFYSLPDLKELNKANINFHWYSYYKKWIPQQNYYYCAEKTGFKPNKIRSEGTYSRYASLDDLTDGFHYYMSYIKFGIGRATSDAAHEVRDKHITREEAVSLVHQYDGEFPSKNYQEFLDYLDINENEFNRIIDKFRTEHIWKKDKDNWVLRKQVS